MKDLKILLYLDFLKIKNGFLTTLNNPLIFLKKFGAPIFFMFFYPLFIINLAKSKGNTISYVYSDTLHTQVLGGLAIISSLIVIGVFAFYLCDYTPRNFSVSDISYLFPSPINNKIILLYAMAKSAFKGVGMFFISIMFFLAMIVSITKVSLVGIIPIAIGLFFILLFFISLSYLLFAIRIKTEFDKELKFISRIFTIILYILITYYIFKLYKYEFNLPLFLSNMGSSYLVSIPIISSISKFLSLLLVETIVPPILDIVFLFLLILFNCYIFTLLNIEYYEAISNTVSDFNEKVKLIKSSKGFGYNTQIENKIKKVNISLSSKERSGVLALYWKCTISRKRRQTSIKKYLLFALNIFISIAGAYATLNGEQLIALVVISVLTIYAVLCFAASSELARELKNLYIYIIPGKPIAKILATILDEMLVIILRISIMIIPSIILNFEYLLLGIGIYFLTILFTLILKMQNLITILLLPKEEDAGPGIFVIVFTMILFMIPAGVTIGVYSITRNPYLAFFALTTIATIYLALIMTLCNKLFNKIEY